MVKRLPAMRKTRVRSLGQEDPWIRKWQPTPGNPLQYPCLENPMDGGAWEATVRGGRKESDMTELLHFHFTLNIRKLRLREVSDGISSLEPRL